MSYVHTNQHTKWFKYGSSVRQGDNLSPTFFALLIKALLVKLNLLQGIAIYQTHIGLFLYSDDTALTSGNDQDKPQILNIVTMWCTKLHLRISLAKLKIIHFRKKKIIKKKVHLHFGWITPA